MREIKRFGRRLAVPSTRQIRHELLKLMAEDHARLHTLEKENVGKKLGELTANLAE